MGKSCPKGKFRVGFRSPERQFWKKKACSRMEQKSLHQNLAELSWSQKQDRLVRTLFTSRNKKGKRHKNWSLSDVHWTWNLASHPVGIYLGWKEQHVVFTLTASNCTHLRTFVVGRRELATSRGRFDSAAIRLCPSPVSGTQNSFPESISTCSICETGIQWLNFGSGDCTKESVTQ